MKITSPRLSVTSRNVRRPKKTPGAGATAKDERPRDESLSEKLHSLGSSVLSATALVGLATLGAKGGHLGVVAASPALFATAGAGFFVGSIFDWTDHKGNGRTGEIAPVRASIGAAAGAGIGALAMKAAHSGGIGGALVAMSGAAVCYGFLSLLSGDSRSAAGDA